MNQLMLESCVHPWDPNSVYKDKCKKFVSSDLSHPWDPNNVYKDKCKRFVSSDLSHPLDPNNVYKDKCKRFVSSDLSHWTLTFYIYLCKHCWYPKDVRSFLTLTGS
jgi:hypothetical protein